MRFIIRAVALIGPVFVAAALGAAQAAHLLGKHHVSPTRAIGCIVACFAIGWGVLAVTRKKNTGQQQQNTRQRFYYPARGRR